MTPRAKRMLTAMLVVSPLLAAQPAWASPTPSAGPSPAPPAPSSSEPAGSPSSGGAFAGGGLLAQVGGLLATATGDGITVTAKVSALLGRVLVFTGAASPASAGETIIAERLDPRAGWVRVAHGTVGPGGVFSVLWRANYAGRLTMRTVLARAASASRTDATSPALQITVYQPAVATFYGPGFFGHRTACGKILTPTALGVASRTLRCGTNVQIYYGGRTIVVPVIDRGPFANDATWDLTQATAQELGMLGTETVGAMPV